MTITAVFGGASLNPYGAFNNDETIKQAFDTLKKEGVKIIDTARLYEGSEETIGRVPGHEDFTIDTKLKGGFDLGSTSKARAIADAEDSLKKANVKQFDILYIHAPDKDTPVEELVESVQELYKKGLFKRFGLSNFDAKEVQEVYDAAKAKGYVLPSVYQGNYNPVARKPEAVLFPTLRKLGFAFYAYSPLAGGFLTKTKADLDQGAGRFNDQAVGGLYNKLYNKPAHREALAEWNDIAEQEGVSKAELAYRWVGYNSAVKEELGDAVIFGASKPSQIEQTAQWLKKGPISKEAAEKIDALWKKVEHEAAADNWDVIKGGK
ncbi:NADP-dependent oxidoreductase domain-containing protein [Lophiotrema nucula]|uniref:NADP-dependent oxidoreductase domain-containing protein n=1 Tax=Lophiotrema nucula TaxID=690887 RepID=A0A6A5YH85_9PLEO|nr:NADP-dependent oxidoreductase domain-containing protein [Lophiotrema nucula]